MNQTTELDPVGAIRPIEPEDYPTLLALNNHFQEETSSLTEERWRELVETSFLSCKFGENLGFLLTFASTQPFSNQNFEWFKQRFAKFVYVDRIVVSAQAQGTGAGRALYEHLFDQARREGFERVTCEVNEQPPNPGSDAFHARLGFEILESVKLTGRDKTVRYMVKELEG